MFDFPYLENCCSLWPISHGILFFIIGILFPDCDIIAIGGGIIWELIEMLMGSVTSKQRQGVRRSAKSKIEYSKNWWAGSMKDILFNIVGFYLGKAVSKSLDLHPCIPHLTDHNCENNNKK
jgi:hypothetical protein